MRKICIVMSVLALCGGTAFSQSWLDAYKYTQNDLSGTARYMSMGGAFGALGGDISSMNTNPAGLAVYRSSEIVTTLSLSAVGSKTNWLGTAESGNRTKASFDNIAYVGYFPTSNDVGIIGWNVGFSYNKVKNYSRNYSMSTGGGLHTSLSDYVASRAFGTSVDDLAFGEKYDPYDSGKGLDWMSVLGYDAGYIDAYNDNKSEYYSAFGDNVNGQWTPYNMEGAKLNVSEKGSINQYNFAFGMNISDILMLGATVAVTDLNYKYTASYDEFFSNSSDLYLDNSLNTDGTGYSFNVGAILRPTNFLRLGVAYNSPTWYKMTDYYYGEAGTYLTFMEDGKETVRQLDAHTPDDGAYTNYEYRSPDKWIFSAAAIIGKIALVSVDYELMNYKNMKMYDRNGYEDNFINGGITTNMQNSNTVRVGAEVKVTPQFSIRGGAAFSNSPMKNPFEHIAEQGITEVPTAGTIPNFVIDKGVTNYTVGLGYRFTPNFYTDLACVFRTQKADAYAFSSIFEDGEPIIEAQSATLKTNTTKVALTLGYKF